MSEPATDPSSERATHHLKIGWWSLLLFLSLGILLEMFHGLKLGLYLDVSNETRRLLWTLAHAHGTLLSLVNLAFAASLQLFAYEDDGALQLASRCLVGATILRPGGFFLGGAVIYDGDPGLGVLLVPVGAVLLALAVFLVARATPSGKA